MIYSINKGTATGPSRLCVLCFTIPFYFTFEKYEYIRRKENKQTILNTGGVFPRLLNFWTKISPSKYVMRIVFGKKSYKTFMFAKRLVSQKKFPKSLPHTYMQTITCRMKRWENVSTKCYALNSEINLNRNVNKRCLVFLLLANKNKLLGERQKMQPNPQFAYGRRWNWCVSSSHYWKFQWISGWFSVFFLDDVVLSITVQCSKFVSVKVMHFLWIFLSPSLIHEFIATNIC